MCNCIKEREIQILEFVQRNFPKNVATDSELQQKAIVFTKEDQVRVSLEFVTKVNRTFKNGTQKVKKIKTNMLLTNCPFCGKEYSKE